MLVNSQGNIELKKDKSKEEIEELIIKHIENETKIPVYRVIHLKNLFRQYQATNFFIHHSCMGVDRKDLLIMHFKVVIEDKARKIPYSYCEQCRCVYFIR